MGFLDKHRKSMPADLTMYAGGEDNFCHTGGIYLMGRSGGYLGFPAPRCEILTSALRRTVPVNPAGVCKLVDCRKRPQSWQVRIPRKRAA